MNEKQKEKEEEEEEGKQRSEFPERNRSNDPFSRLEQHE